MMRTDRSDRLSPRYPRRAARQCRRQIQEFYVRKLHGVPSRKAVDDDERQRRAIADHFSNRRLECAPGNEIVRPSAGNGTTILTTLSVRSVLRPSALGDRANTENGTATWMKLWFTDTLCPYCGLHVHFFSMSNRFGFCQRFSDIMSTV